MEGYINKTLNIIKRVINRLLKCFQITNIPSNGRLIYLTFDDGPEPGITEFVLEELEKYGFKATFFCRGDHAEMYPELLAMIRQKGHALANHTYSHLHAYDVLPKVYMDDVEKAEALLHTALFRPPKGDLTIPTFLHLRKMYKIIYWALNSEDSARDRFDYERSYSNLISRTKPGDVILFHFCKKHESETRRILPDYLKWLNENAYQGSAIQADL